MRLGTALLATILFVAPALLGCPSSATLRSAPAAGRDGLAPVHVHNAGAREVTLVIGELRDPSAFECALLLQRERVSVRAFALRTVHLAPGANVAIEGRAGDGSCGAVQLASSGTARVLGWRSDDLSRVDVPAYGELEVPGRVELDEHGLAISPGTPFFEVPTAP